VRGIIGFEDFSLIKIMITQVVKKTCTNIFSIEWKVEGRQKERGRQTHTNKWTGIDLHNI